MKIPPHKFSNPFRIACAVVLTFMSILPALFPSDAFAAQITARSLILEKNGTTGGSTPGGSVNHHFKFTIPTTAGIHSILFKYCTTAADPTGGTACTTPTGMDSTPASLGPLVNLSGFTLTHATNGAPYLSNAGGVPGGNAVEATIDAVKNPTAANSSFFVRISTYTSNDTTGASTDAGVVTASTANPIVLTGVMPESLVFCTGQSISTTASVPDCTTATSGSISFDKLFSPVDTAVAVSEMAASTNAGSGYVITVNGATLTSGANTITALAVPSASNKGVSQFGLNLRANTAASAACWPASCGATPALYTPSDIAAASNGTNLRGNPRAHYATADTFTYIDGDPVAASDQASGSPVPSDSQIYDCSYIVNVPGSQPAGTYTTTLSYIATATF